jgi:hypothetical protein
LILASVRSADDADTPRSASVIIMIEAFPRVFRGLRAFFYGVEVG